MRLRREAGGLVLTAAIAVGIPAGWAALSVRARTPDAAAGRPIDAAGSWSCPMHPDVTRHGPGTCPACGMALTEAAAAASAARGPARAAVSIDTRRQQLMGIRTAAVTRASLLAHASAFGVVCEDPARVVDVNPRVEGWIERLYVTSTGRLLRQGDPLFSLGSPTLQTTQLEYLQALRKRETTKAEGVDYAARVRERLGFLDVPADQIAAAEQAGRPLPEVLFRSPISGSVVELRAVRGRRVMPGDTIMRIVDLSTVWVEAELRDRDRGLVAVGGHATVTIDGLAGEPLDARVVAIAPFVDERSRTATLRLEVPNRDGRLQPGMKATVRVEEALDAAVAVPTDAVLDSGTRRIVFVAGGNGFFEPRDVTIGRRADGFVQILSGLQEGQHVAVGANFLLDSESQLQAALNGYAPRPQPPASALPSLSADLRTRPDPPRSGDIELEVSARLADGRPVSGRELTVVFSMPAMPTMNMPAMRSEARLRADADGRFRGTGHLSMAGRWNVAIVADGATANLTLVAR